MNPSNDVKYAVMAIIEHLLEHNIETNTVMLRLQKVYNICSRNIITNEDEYTYLMNLINNDLYEHSTDSKYESDRYLAELISSLRVSFRRFVDGKKQYDATPSITEQLTKKISECESLKEHLKTYITAEDHHNELTADSIELGQIYIWLTRNKSVESTALNTIKQMVSK